MTVTPVSRRRVSEAAGKFTPSACSTKYYVRNGERKMVQVCVKALTKILHIPKSRLQMIARKFFVTGIVKEG